MHLLFESKKYRQHSVNEIGANIGFKGFQGRAKQIFSGERFFRVLQQASFIGQEAILPIKLLNANKRLQFL